MTNPIKFPLSLLAAGLLAVVSCNKTPAPEPETVPEGGVDLGIVMTRTDGSTYKLYWAESNLTRNGLCQHPEDYGEYYAWAETKPYCAQGHSQDDPCKDWEAGKSGGYYWDSYRWKGPLLWRSAHGTLSPAKGLKGMKWLAPAETASSFRPQVTVWTIC